MKIASSVITMIAFLTLSGTVWAQDAAPAGAGAAATSDAAGGAGRGPRNYKYAWAPHPSPLTPWPGPGKPHWKLSEILAAHAGQKSWDQPLVRDDYNNADYIQMAPGERTKTLFYADTDAFWIVQSGQMRVNIEGQDPFVASKGFVIWVPYRTPFYMETVGDEPSLRFEVTKAGATPLYTVDQTPPTVKGQKYIKVAYASAPGKYPDGVKPYFDYNKEVIEKGDGPAPRIIPDGVFIRGHAVPMPPDDDWGHYHIDYSEFWYVMEGKMAYKIEGVPVFTADQGDVMYAPHGRYHRTSFAGDGMATRLAIFPAGGMNNLDADNPSKSQPR